MADTEMLPIEVAGEAMIVDGVLDVGGLQIQTGRDDPAVWVYVRRSSENLTVLEVVIPYHDGMADELHTVQDEEAQRYPLGPKEYWRSVMVNHYTWGDDSHYMTDEDFDEYWESE